MYSKSSSIVLVFGLAALTTACAPQPELSGLGPQVAGAANRCAQMAMLSQTDNPVPGLKISTASWQPDGTEVNSRDGSLKSPAHCLVEGSFAERDGTIGGPYKIAFRMRLPENWNGKFFFQGGGGSNGVVGDALGHNGAGNTPALTRGYAVIAQDSGHDNALNFLPDHQGNLVFGFDPEARRNYGHASLKPVYDIGRALVRDYYGKDSATNIFWGCSKGGQEGMAFAQRYPDAFDGIVAMAPGMSLPRAAVAEAWDTQAFAGIFRAKGQKPTVEGYKSLFSKDQLGLLSSASLAACDADDGTRDGIIGTVGQCTTAKVEPELRKLQCSAIKTQPCMEDAQINALVKVMEGPHDSNGKQLYAPFAWDSGVGAEGWQVWKFGLENGPPSLNILLGGGSLAAVFTSPPTPLSGNPETLLAWQLAFDFDDDAARIYAVASPFTTSAWKDVGMRSTDWAAFRARGGKLIVPHGVSDPVFSVLDTIHWWNEVNKMEHGTASDFVRVFPIPGMNHCRGGPATDQFDSLTAIEQWVADNKAPDSIDAKAGPNTPWPGKEMPLCPYPETAVLRTEGNISIYRCLALQDQ